jgi:hypothetical protein
MIDHRPWICAAVLTLLTTAPGFAMASWFPEAGRNHGGRSGGVSHSAPGPEVGVGLSALVVGGYVWYRHWSRRRRK